MVAEVVAKATEGFFPAFTASFMMILATEIGDRTFFIAAIMAMRHPRMIVLGGALAALILMTVISGVFGLAAMMLIPRVYIHYVVVGLMLVIGAQLIRTGLKIPVGKEGFDELDEVEEETRKKEIEEGRSEEEIRAARTWTIAMQAFTLTFLNEWGDRSQVATIALSAVHDTFGVMAGGFIGHALCTTGAVIGGRLVARYVTERTVTLAGGVLFVLFGLWSLVMGE
eukprot:TRINITY_DN9411_c0_g1_i1.p1 TRINITY_DN9411_c0_g1~~TRINITY_DN9411_c0_g1_i1.p1  ORF type:complete len:226 (-),score=48.82 TRINITY_DN9411_c0_g1_i1:115-792(-)